MRFHIVMDGNAFYEVDDACIQVKEAEEKAAERKKEEQRRTELRAGKEEVPSRQKEKRYEQVAKTDCEYPFDGRMKTDRR